MRHRKAGRKLGRTWEHRKAMFRSMARSLLTHERIRTTEAKAKELRKLADRLISFGLENNLHARRKAYKVLENHGLVKRLFDEIAPRYADVPGGYTRVVKLGLPRRGDAAPMAVIEFTEPRTEVAPETKTKKTAKKKAEPKPEASAAKSAAPEGTAPADKEKAAEAVPEIEAEEGQAPPEAGEPTEAAEEAPQEMASQEGEATEEGAAEAPDEPEEEKK